MAAARRAGHLRPLAPCRTYLSLWYLVVLLADPSIACAERASAEVDGEGGSLTVEAPERGAPEGGAPEQGAAQEPRLAYSKMTKHSEELEHVTDDYKEKTIKVQDQAAKSKEKADLYSKQLQSLDAGHVALNVGLAKLKSAVEAENNEYMRKVREALGSSGADRDAVEGGLADPEDFDKFERSEALSSEEESIVAGAVDATIAEDEQMEIKDGKYRGNHFRLELRWKKQVDLDLRMVVKGQKPWNFDKIMHVNWQEPCKGVFCLKDDQRGGAPKDFKVEVIYLRKNWKQINGKPKVPDGKYSAWVQYYSAKSGSAKPVKPKNDWLDQEIEYEAALWLGKEFGQEGKGPSKVGAVKGRLKWSDNIIERTKALFAFEVSRGKVTGLNLEDAPFHAEPGDGWNM